MLNEKEKQLYFGILCNNDYPKFIDKYIALKEMQRLRGISFFNGSDYTKLQDIKYWYSRLDHSIAISLITWNFTHDKVQTLSSLFYDLKIPAFSKCIDLLLDENKEKNNKNIYNIINNSNDIKRNLIEDNIDINKFKDINKFLLLNNSNNITVTKIDEVLTTCLIYKRYWDLSTVKKIYSNLVLLPNIEEKEILTFKDVLIAELFFDGVIEYNMILQKNEKKYTLKYLSDILKKMINLDKLTLGELYKLNEIDILLLLQLYSDSFRTFQITNNIERTNEKPENNYYVCLDVNKNYTVPLCINGNKIERLSDISSKCKQQLDEYNNFQDSKYAYVKKIEKI